MSLTLEIPPALEQRLRTIASEQGISVEQVGEQALSVGLEALRGVVPDVVLSLSPSDAVSTPPTSDTHAISTEDKWIATNAHYYC